MFCPSLHLASTTRVVLSSAKIYSQSLKEQRKLCMPVEITRSDTSPSIYFLNGRPQSIFRYPAPTETAPMESLLTIIKQETDEAELHRVITCQQVFELRVVGAINRHLTC